MVKAANWLSHLDYDWQSSVWRHWLVGLAQGREPKNCGGLCPPHPPRNRTWARAWGLGHGVAGGADVAVAGLAVGDDAAVAADGGQLGLPLLLLIALGAILTWAVNKEPSGLDLDAVAGAQRHRQVGRVALGI
jgi:hypothetical protein